MPDLIAGFNLFDPLVPALQVRAQTVQEGAQELNWWLQVRRWGGGVGRNPTCGSGGRDTHAGRWMQAVMWRLPCHGKHPVANHDVLSSHLFLCFLHCRRRATPAPAARPSSSPRPPGRPSCTARWPPWRPTRCPGASPPSSTPSGHRSWRASTTAPSLTSATAGSCAADCGSPARPTDAPPWPAGCVDAAAPDTALSCIPRDAAAATRPDPPCVLWDTACDTVGAFLGHPTSSPLHPRR